MTHPLPISVFIIAKDEADRIVHTLRSLEGWVDEVIVVDSGSTDDTIDLSTQMGATVYAHTWEGYGPQKCFAESKCTHRWLLNLDADEAISDALKNEIQDLFTDGPPSISMWRLPILIMSRFASKPGRFAPSNKPVRLYDRKVAGFRPSLVHDSVIPKKGFEGTPIASCQHPVWHRCFRSLSHAVSKINFYSTMQAQDWVEKGRPVTTLRLIFEPFLAFLKAYFFRRYIFLGMDGLIESFIYAFARTLRLAKARERFLEVKNGLTDHSDSVGSPNNVIDSNKIIRL